MKLIKIYLHIPYAPSYALRAFAIWPYSKLVVTLCLMYVRNKFLCYRFIHWVPKRPKFTILPLQFVKSELWPWRDWRYWLKQMILYCTYYYKNYSQWFYHNQCIIGLRWKFENPRAIDGPLENSQNNGFWTKFQ